MTSFERLSTSLLNTSILFRLRFRYVRLLRENALTSEVGETEKVVDLPNIQCSEDLAPCDLFLLKK